MAIEYIFIMIQLLLLTFRFNGQFRQVRKHVETSVKLLHYYSGISVCLSGGSASAYLAHSDNKTNLSLSLVELGLGLSLAKCLIIYVTSSKNIQVKYFTQERTKLPKSLYQLSHDSIYAYLQVPTIIKRFFISRFEMSEIRREKDRKISASAVCDPRLRSPSAHT